MKAAAIILMFIIPTDIFGQETIFSVMQGSNRLGDQEFAKKDYKKAIDYYQRSISKEPNNAGVLSKMAQCYYLLKDHQHCIDAYDAMMKAGGTLGASELLRYAESQSSVGNYPVAIAYYKRCLESDPQNEQISKKIWALSNINFLQEDSSHYRVKILNEANTRASEIGPAVFSNALVFSSNRKGARPIDAATDEPAGSYYELYIIEWEIDSVTKERKLSRPSHFAKSLDVDYNAGPVAFYGQHKKMVLVASLNGKTPEKTNAVRPLGLYFAELKDSKWKVTSSWDHNSNTYSISDVSINEQGDRLFFSSDMKGGTGGKDLYTSVLKNGKWTTPVNLGETINTPGNEVFPYLHRNGTLYFSSDGLAGVGGLDVFQSTIRSSGYSEPENIGYPINSPSDDFGLTFDSLVARGYFISNRANGGFDDDIYEFEMDLQTYPFQMTGILKFKEHPSGDTLDIHLWPNMELSLIDTWDNIEVQKTTSGPDGAFAFTIPYFSRYHILVTDENGYTHKASLELEKYRTEGYRYEIVVVKELIAELKQPEQR